MLRKSFVIISITLLALSGCGSKHKDQEAHAPVVGVPGGQPSAPGAPGAPGQTSTPAACPTKATRHFAKTRFVTNAGLAAGTFKRYILTPYKSGAFKSGAPKQKRSIVKAAAAALFVLDQLRRAKTNAQADPTLCKILISPIDRLSTAVGDLANKFKRGQVDPAEIGAVSGGIEGFRRDASSAGAGFQDKTPPPSVVGG